MTPNTALHRTPAAAPLSPVNFQALGGLAWHSEGAASLLERAVP